MSPLSEYSGHLGFQERQQVGCHKVMPTFTLAQQGRKHAGVVPAKGRFHSEKCGRKRGPEQISAVGWFVSVCSLPAVVRTLLVEWFH